MCACVIMPQLDFLMCYRTAFEPGTLASLLVEHVGNVTVDF